MPKQRTRKTFSLNFQNHSPNEEQCYDHQRADLSYSFFHAPRISYIDLSWRTNQDEIKHNALNSCLWAIPTFHHFRFFYDSENAVAKLSYSKLPLRVQKLARKLTEEVSVKYIYFQDPFDYTRI